MDKSEPCLVPFTRHSSAVSHMTLHLQNVTEEMRITYSYTKKCWELLYAVC